MTSSPVNSEHVTIVVELRVQPAALEQAVQVLTGFVDEVTTEPDSVGVRMYRDPTDPAHFLFTETFSSQQALDTHNASDHLQAFYARIGPLLDGPTSNTSWTLAKDNTGPAA